MTTDNYSLFDAQLLNVIEKYANLKIEDYNGKNIIKGILDIPDDNKNIAGSFLIEIHYKYGFPNRFPVLFETGGDIPESADWHKYPDGSCCITVAADEILKCKNGISVLRFVDSYAIPYLANFLHWKMTKKYKNGEYAHGKEGLKQFYTELCKTPDFSKWVDYLKASNNNTKYNQQRNKKCFCGSGTKYKNCHDKVFYTMRQIGEKQILKDFNRIIT